jgi:GntR family transcriptional regulator, rspAB operon transcriptional repressor
MPVGRSQKANVVPFSPQEPQSLRDAAYEAIKHRIITCAFKPGEYLNEAYVSAALGIGRTPVHQAIDRLMLDGLVEVIPRKGVIVKPVSLDEIMQIIEIRLLNESYCVRLAADRAGPDEIAHLSDVLARARQWTEARDTEHLMLLDREFHSALARASQNAVLRDTLLKLHDRSLRFWFISLNRPGQHDSVHKQHEAILAAIKDRDPGGAQEAMRAHIEAFRHNLLQSL